MQVVLLSITKSRRGKLRQDIRYSVFITSKTVISTTSSKKGGIKKVDIDDHVSPLNSSTRSGAPIRPADPSALNK